MGHVRDFRIRPHYPRGVHRGGGRRGNNARVKLVALWVVTRRRMSPSTEYRTGEKGLGSHPSGVCPYGPTHFPPIRAGGWAPPGYVEEKCRPLGPSRLREAGDAE